MPTPTLETLDRYFRATNYLGGAQLYLRDNVFLRRALVAQDVKPRLLGHWGTQPGLNFVYAHLNRLIARTDARMLLVTGPGHGAPAILANVFLEGTLGAVDPSLARDGAGATRLVRSFSWPGGRPSHVTPSVPGAIHEGGELGYCLLHAVGAALDDPELVVACIVGDGEAETAPLAGSWQFNKFLDPATSGAVLPIVHVNGYKLANPTLFGRLDDAELVAYFEGLGYEPHVVSGDEPAALHAAMAATIDRAYDAIRAIQTDARNGGGGGVPAWPVVVLRTPKGWTGPVVVDGKPVEGTTAAHQIPISDPAGDAGHLAALEAWLRGYRPAELFDDAGDPRPEVLAALPPEQLRLGAAPAANGGRLTVDLALPPLERHAAGVDPSARGATDAEATCRLGEFLRDVFAENASSANFRIVSPDEATSNRISPVFEQTARAWLLPTVASDAALAPDGRVMEILSEHACEGWLEGYTLTGRHGVFVCYEAFAQIVDSMAGLHAKWLKMASEVPWRAAVPSLNVVLTSHVWRQDHNGYSHQGPGFIDTLLHSKRAFARIYLAADANVLLAATEVALRSRDRINLIVAGKHDAPQWLTPDEARAHVAAGASDWRWAGSPGEPDVVLACAGDVPTVETLAAASLLRDAVPSLRFRVTNVVDLTVLDPTAPGALDAARFTELFTSDRPVVFAFHGYPGAVNQLVHGRPDVGRFHVRGYDEEGTTTTPFDMVVRNRLSRYHLAIEAVRRSSHALRDASRAVDRWTSALAKHAAYIREHGEDMPEIRDWSWA